MSDDQELVRRTLAGDDAAAEEIAETVRRLVLGLARGRFGLDPDGAQELLQMVLTRLWEHDRRALRAWRGHGKLTTYVTVIVSRLWLRERERQARRSAIREVLPEVTTIAPRSPAQNLVSAERRRVVREALASLAPRDRLLVVLRFVDERQPREIARLLGLKPGTARKAVHDAVRRLRRRLDAAVPPPGRRGARRAVPVEPANEP